MLNRVLVISLDGTPHSLVKQRAGQPGSVWPELLSRGKLVRIRSSRPEMSSVAWASYLTGANPGEHGVFGFVERDPVNPAKLIYPNGKWLQRPSLIQRVHDNGGSVVSVNIPMTSPPDPVRGAVIGGFLGVRLKGNVHPPALEKRLVQNGYILDADVGLAYRDRDRLMKQLFAALDARVEAAWQLAHEINWDYFHLHIMETDRLFHFFWDDAEYAGAFDQLLARAEAAALRFADFARKRGAQLVILSDHGFTRCRRIVFVNALLKKMGLLRLQSGARSDFPVAELSAAYALAPGRIFLRADSDDERDRSRDRVASVLRDLKDPELGTRPFASVDIREDLYQGPHVSKAADLIALPTEGYDLKADFDADSVFASPRVLVGTHTYDDAFLLAPDEQIPNWTDGVRDIANTGAKVAEMLSLPVDSENQGGIIRPGGFYKTS